MKAGRLSAKTPAIQSGGVGGPGHRPSRRGGRPRDQTWAACPPQKIPEATLSSAPQCRHVRRAAFGGRVSAPGVSKLSTRHPPLSRSRRGGGGGLGARPEDGTSRRDVSLLVRSMRVARLTGDAFLRPSWPAPTVIGADFFEANEGTTTGQSGARQLSAGGVAAALVSWRRLPGVGFAWLPTTSGGRAATLRETRIPSWGGNARVRPPPAAFRRPDANTGAPRRPPAPGAVLDVVVSRPAVAPPPCAPPVCTAAAAAARARSSFCRRRGVGGWPRGVWAVGLGVCGGGG